MNHVQSIPRSDPALSAFDLVTIGHASDAGRELRARFELARNLEQAGAHGIWFGEHHLGPGRAGASSLALVALTAAHTTTLQVGAAVAVLPHYRPLALVEGFGTVAAAYPGRVRLGLGRGRDYGTFDVPDRVRQAARGIAHRSDDDLPDLDESDFHALLGELLQVGPSDPDGYEQAVLEVLSLLRRPVATVNGSVLAASPGYGTDVEPWIFGFGGLRSAEFAATHGLPFAVNHHVGAGGHAEAVAVYRELYRPSSAHPEPHVAVSVHALAAATAREAQHLSSTYPAWFSHVLRRGFSVPVPAPGAPVLELADEQQRTLEATMSIRLVGEAAQVVDQIRDVAAHVAADEVLVNTVAHDTTAYLTSFELIADAWRASAGSASRPPQHRSVPTPAPR